MISIVLINAVNSLITITAFLMMADRWTFPPLDLIPKGNRAAFIIPEIFLKCEGKFPALFFSELPLAAALVFLTEGGFMV